MSKNSLTGQNRPIRKPGDLTGTGKGDWLRIGLMDKQYKINYNKIFGKKCPSSADDQEIA